MHTSEISQMDWCQYTIDCLIDAILIWKKNPFGFTGSLLFLTLFYLDRVEFIGSQIERKAPILCCWNAKAIEERCKAEIKAGNFGFGRILPPIRIKSDADTIINDIVPVHSTTNDQGESSRKSTEDLIDTLSCVTKNLATNFIQFGQVLSMVQKQYPGSECIKKIQSTAVDMFTKFSEKQQPQPEVEPFVSNLNEKSNSDEYDAFFDEPGVLEAIDALVNAYQETCGTHNQQETRKKTNIPNEICATPEQEQQPDVPSFDLGLDLSPFVRAPQSKDINLISSTNAAEIDAAEIDAPEIETERPIVVALQGRLSNKKGKNKVVHFDTELEGKLENKRQRPLRKPKNLPLQISEVLYHYKGFQGERHLFSSLLEEYVDTGIIDIWSLLLNRKEAGRGLGSPKRFFIPPTACVNLTEELLRRKKPVLQCELEFHKRLLNMLNCSEYGDMSDVDLVSN
ncbi:uncharacterized protein LOC109134322 [Beta vulgaris subsp. vulgaris]|uniref:uncharacterized protein LOC109134322 n=1 Tax=Beta vulgaris subsp. vulgaris TaxID=3555 RepID=UPI0025499548|nr:uncharacterized protein LOC109134322 [Beta vulgaris subsp. vulgaris]